MISKLMYLLQKSENKTILSFVIRKLFKDSRFINLENLIKLNALSRPQYAYCTYYSAMLAKLNYKKISFLNLELLKETDCFVLRS